MANKEFEQLTTKVNSLERKFKNKREPNKTTNDSSEQLIFLIRNLEEKIIKQNDLIIQINKELLITKALIQWGLDQKYKK